MFRVDGSDGRKIAACRFGDPASLRAREFSGRTLLSAQLKAALISKNGPKCAIYLEPFPERELQIDHRIPYEVGGEPDQAKLNPNEFMLLCGSANRAKSWSCEHCENWLQHRDTDTCKSCYWAYPEGYTHVAMRDERRIDLVWSGDETKKYERLRDESVSAGQPLPSFVKEILDRRIQ